MASAPSSLIGPGSKSKQYPCEMYSKSLDGIDTLNLHKRLDHSESGRSQSPAGTG
jgi:hypothetical protein